MNTCENVQNEQLGHKVLTILIDEHFNRPKETYLNFKLLKQNIRHTFDEQCKQMIIGLINNPKHDSQKTKRGLS